MAERIPKSTTIRVPLEAFLSSDHITPATGKTIAITISKNGAAFGNPSAGATNATEIANGSYYVDLSTTDTGTDGPLIVKGTEGTIDQIKAHYYVAVFATTTEIADAILTRDWTSVTGEAARSMLNALRFLRNKWSISGTTLTVTEEDDSTTAWTSTVTTNASAEPITGSDPA